MRAWMRTCFGAFVSIALSTSAWAWGDMGHSVVAEIAQRRLNDAAAQEVKKLLGSGSLASVASWADDVKYSKKPPTANWHFVDIPYSSAAYDEQRDCYPTESGDCIVAELNRLRNDLRCAPSEEGKLEALKFAVHFVGDVHQPWHTILDGRGGNEYAVTITYPGVRKADPEPTNIHFAWDGDLLEHSAWNWGTIVDDVNREWLDKPVASTPGITDGTPGDWANETHRMAQKVYAMTPKDGQLDKRYFDDAMPIIYQQLGLAGLRLARFLNDAYSSTECPVK